MMTGNKASSLRGCTRGSGGHPDQLELSSTLTQCCHACFWSSVAQGAAPGFEEMQRNWRVWSRGLPRWASGLEAHEMERLRDLGSFGPVTWRLQEIEK